MTSKEHLQDIFDKVAKHLLTQNARSFIVEDIWGKPKESCVYRSPDGLKCAAGVLIPDELYDKSFEGRKFRQLPFDVKRACGALDNEAIVFIGELQEVHDFDPIELWKEKLKRIANSYELTSDVPNEKE